MVRSSTRLVAAALLIALGDSLRAGPRGYLKRRLPPVGLLEEDAVPRPAHSSHGEKVAMQYYGLVRVGSPAQEFRVVFDTASGQLVLPSSKCDDNACTLHRRFASENSTSVVQIGWADDPTKGIADGDDRDTKSLSLLGSDVSGEFVRDNICLGDTGHRCGVADFVALSEESDDQFNDLAFDGVLGLLPVSPDAQEFNVLQAINGKHGADASMFSLYLSRSESNSVGGGEIMFGGIDASRAASTFTWAPVSVNGTWQVKVDDITVGGKPTGLCGKNGCQANVDSGSSLLYAPGPILGGLLPKLGIDEECTHDPPAIGFVVNGKELALHGADVIDRSDGCEMLLGIAGDNGKGPMLVLGYPFLRSYYTVFDAQRGRVGFATAKHGEQTKPENHADAAVVKLVGVRP